MNKSNKTLPTKRLANGFVYGIISVLDVVRQFDITPKAYQSPTKPRTSKAVVKKPRGSSRSTSTRSVGDATYTLVHSPMSTWSFKPNSKAKKQSTNSSSSQTPIRKKIGSWKPFTGSKRLKKISASDLILSILGFFALLGLLNYNGRTASDVTEHLGLLYLAFLMLTRRL